ncbi:AraC family transcriptional regulator [Alteromonadaceae bacterium M269]|nr:AraC family transcriptional regulator [Alteromonadaceae bacterium M269]
MSRKLNTNTPYLPTSHAELLINWLVSQGYSQTLLLENTSLSMEELNRCCTLITPTQLRQLILNARRITNDPSLGLKFGEHIGRNAMGILGLACKTSRTYEEALKVFVQYFCLRNPMLELSFSQSNREFSIAFYNRGCPEDILDYIYQVFTTAIYHFFSDISNGKVFPIGIGLTIDTLGPWEPSMPSCKLELETKLNYINFDTQYLGQSLVTSESAVHMQLMETLQIVSTSRSEASNLTTKVRQYLIESDIEDFDLTHVASELAMSPRNLSRGLKKVGTSFSQIKDEVRIVKVKQMILENQSNVREVSVKMGFDDTSKFRKAFKRWVGISLNEYLCSLRNRAYIDYNQETNVHIYEEKH